MKFAVKGLNSIDAKVFSINYLFADEEINHFSTNPASGARCGVVAFRDENNRPVERIT